MQEYLIRLKYEQIAFQNFIANPHNRKESLRPTVEKLGGEIKDIWFAVGRPDLVAIIAFPDNVSMVALSMAAKAKGYIKDMEITPLLSIDESIESMKKASVEINIPKRGY